MKKINKNLIKILTGISIVLNSYNLLAQDSYDYEEEYDNEERVDSYDPNSIYIRIDLGYGITNSKTDTLSYELYEYKPGMSPILLQDATHWGHTELESSNFTSINIGAGYAMNNIRVEAAFKMQNDVEYKSKMIMYDKLYYNADDAYNTLEFEGSVNSKILMVNGFIDAKNGTDFLVPYIGAGLGYAFHDIGSLTQTDTNSYDFDPTTGLPPFGLTFDPRATEIDGKITEKSFVKAFYTGIGFNFGDFLVIDLGYSYINLGEIRVSIPEYEANIMPEGNEDDYKSLRKFNEHDIPSIINEFRIGLRIHF